jgi:RNA polymerase sigma factor (sigma-70 family)
VREGWSAGPFQHLLMSLGNRRLRPEVLEPEGAPPECRVAAGQAAALDTLYRDEAPRLLRYFRRRTGNCQSAADMVQDAFLRLAGLGGLGDLVNPAAYLQRIAGNLLADRARGRAARDALHLELANCDAEVPPQQEDRLLADEMLRLYEQAIGDLPARTRTIFLLQRGDGLTYREIAERLDVTLWTVEHHMKRAIAHLDRSLDQS